MKPKIVKLKKYDPKDELPSDWWNYNLNPITMKVAGGTNYYNYANQR